MPKKEPKELTMTFDPNTIEHLGVRMYSTLPPVLAELIANAYDSDATRVALTLNDTGEKAIIVEDDGLGMSFVEINRKFLRIGRNRREGESETTPRGRKVIGKKGLGKLSFFGVAHEVEITTKQGGKKNSFLMRWEDIKSGADGDYKPKILGKNLPCGEKSRGTKIVLKKIQRKSGFVPAELASSIAKIFTVGPNFQITIQHNSDKPIPVLNKMRFGGLKKEVVWEISKDSVYLDGYANAAGITGHLMATEKPIPPKTGMRGIILFSRNKLVNQPEHFSESGSSHFFSYLTGWLEVDFIDDLVDDVISTNRQSLNWEHEEMRKLREYLGGLVSRLERDWRAKRAVLRAKGLKEKAGIDTVAWFSKLPGDVRANIEPVVKTITEDSELSIEAQRKTVKKIHAVAPEYPKYHWRQLHKEIQSASEADYQNGDYYRAFQEAVKRYISAVKTKSGSTNSSDSGVMGDAFGNNNKLQVAQNFKKPNGDDFPQSTLESVQDGQKLLSMGVVSGCRNPVSHEEISDLRDSGLFTEKDCLDALSLLSHLFYRLDNSQKKRK